MKKNQESIYHLRLGRGLWIQAIEGSFEMNGRLLNSGDGAHIEKEADITFKARQDVEFLMFDLK